MQYICIDHFMSDLSTFSSRDITPKVARWYLSQETVLKPSQLQ
jgi:hypothetical protein